MLKIEKGAKKVPIALAIYGVEGVGKTTFAGALPGALIVDVEKGSMNYDFLRITDIDGWTGLMNILRELYTNAAEYHKSGVKTIVFDSVDAIENTLLIPHILENSKAQTLAEMEWGKGYELESRAFSTFLTACAALKASGYNIAFIVHSTQKEVNPPDTPPYSHYELKLNKKISAALKESVDMLLFFNFKITVGSDKGMGKGKAAERVMVCNHTAYADAKNRFGLDTVLPMDVKMIAALMEA